MESERVEGNGGSGRHPSESRPICPGLLKNCMCLSKTLMKMDVLFSIIKAIIVTPIFQRQNEITATQRFAVISEKSNCHSDSGFPRYSLYKVHSPKLKFCFSASIHFFNKFTPTLSFNCSCIF